MTEELVITTETIEIKENNFIILSNGELIAYKNYQDYFDIVDELRDRDVYR